MTTAAAESGTTAAILDWLAAQPSGSTTGEIAQLAHQLAQLADPTIGPAQHHRCIELFYSRSLRIASDFKPRLIEAGLPLDRTAYDSAKRLCESLNAIAKGFLRVTQDVRDGAIRPQRRLVETLAARGLRMLSEALEIAALSGSFDTSGLWPNAMALFEISGLDASPSEAEAGESAQFAFKRLATFGCLQLERLSQNEIAWVGDYLNRIASLLQIGTQAPASADTPSYWLVAGSDTPPQSLSRAQPASGTPALYLSTAALAKRVGEHLGRLEAGQQPFELNLPKVAIGVQPMALLQRLRFEWAIPAKREQPRRKARYPVQACTGIPAIWKILRGEGNAQAQEWEVVNESPGGFSILHVAGIADNLSAGMAVALRTQEDAAWTICVVRWIRSEIPSQVELGLQVVSTGATPVMVGFRGSRERPNKMVPALVLPALPALRHHPAVLAPTGTYTSRRFALVSDLDRVYVAQGRLLSLDMQTASVELFQFEIDPYPI
ncbi:hypothetical protein [Niveibacterium sp. SC-1]|uniref:hypothetical protein n=1 Tax=Niveibacterium sp. SC-1 TaxID=3135646 RepID=UPI00311E8A2C